MEPGHLWLDGQQAQTPLSLMKLCSYLRLVKGKASQVAVCAGEGEAVAVSRPSGVRTVCSVGQPSCLLLFCCFDQRSEAQASQDYL